MGTRIRQLLTIIVAGYCTACTQSMIMEVSSEIPTAATDSAAQQVGLFLPTEFKNYVYQENTPERQNWEIHLGSSQAQLFQQILNAIYGQVSLVNSNHEENSFDLFVVPRLIEMQLATPTETGFSFFEAWLNYQVTIKSANDSANRSFVMTAYGKQNTTRFQRFQTGLHQAIENALRDAGAKLTVKLTTSSAPENSPNG